MASFEQACLAIEERTCTHRSETKRKDISEIEERTALATPRGGGVQKVERTSKSRTGGARANGFFILGGFLRDGGRGEGDGSPSRRMAVCDGWRIGNAGLSKRGGFFP